MRDIPALVAPAPVDDVAAEQVIVWRDEERQADASGARHEQLGAAARATAKSRRLMIGELCAKQRAQWPTSGPRARGWGEWLARAKLDDSTAWRYIDAWKNRNKPDDDVGDPSQPPAVRGKSDPPPSAQSIGDRDATPANVLGASGAPARGTYCTPRKYAMAVGPWDLDPFSNPRSHIVAIMSCQLERDDDGIADPSRPGSFRTNGGLIVATETTRVWLQPPYTRGFVERVIAHYGHTRFCALLRFAPDTEWFAKLWPLVRVIALPRERLPFETPDGVEIEGADEGEDRGAPFPHVFYYRDERDVTDAIRALCIVLRVDH